MTIWTEPAPVVAPPDDEPEPITDTVAEDDWNMSLLDAPEADDEAEERAEERDEGEALEVVIDVVEGVGAAEEVGGGVVEV